MNNKLSDIKINQNTKLKPISEVAKNFGISQEKLIPYGTLKAKIKEIDGLRKSKLVLVTAINPTRAGEGKTTISIGLSDALNQMGHKTIVALREPSLGPVFGIKGGATGGGYSQVAPIEDINLHFTGDLHAITAANNLLAAAIDNHIHWGNDLKIKDVTFKRCVDMNDRTLRGSFQITAASEIMAIFTLSKDIEDLRKRINKIVIGFNEEQKPIFAKGLNITGSILALLKDSLKPNLVQTLEHNPVFIHGGPFANIAHGCNSIIATDTAMKLSDITITEAGFGADLGMEKFLNIKSRQGNLNPNIIVIVATIRALKLQGGASKEEMAEEGINSLKEGIKLLEKHISNIKGFNVNYVVAVNEFDGDHDSEKELMKKWAKENNHPFAFTSVWANGGKGAHELGQLVLDNMSDKKIHFTYNPAEDIEEKISKIAKDIYGANGVEYSEEALKEIEFLKKNNLDKQYICIAKTPSSITDNAKINGVPKEWNLKVRSIKVSNGAGFLVVYCGNVMTMPGLPKKPQAQKIDIDGNKIIGLD